jgi:uncharacterized protein YdhG (YjbR/CyaY superfamily)
VSRENASSAEVVAYLEGLDPDRQAALTELRKLILDAVPDVVETTRYRMPTYDYGDHMLCAFASQKHYMSLYMDTEIVGRYRGDLDNLSIGKSCIRFKRLEDLPLDTVRLMLTDTVVDRERK